MAVETRSVSQPAPKARPRPKREREEEVLVWPDLVFIEFISAVLFTITFLILSVFINAPLHDKNFEVSGVRDCVEFAMKAYGALAEFNLVAVYPDCGHDFPPDVREQSYKFIDHELRMNR